MMNKPIGGFFEFELNKGEEYHKEAIKINTARNALEYILISKKIRKVYLPYYCCEVILEPIHKWSVKYEFYNIDKNFMPFFDFSMIEEGDAFLYINYFGVCDQNVDSITKINSSKIIVDNSQAFFCLPQNNTDTFYSARKYFGVSDGAYLYTEKKMDIDLPQDYSYDRLEHLIGRIEFGPEESYSHFVKNNLSLSGLPIKKMSKLTQLILSNINYRKIAETRKNNYNYINSFFSKFNQLTITENNFTVPMIYPLLIENGCDLKKYFIKNKIFVPDYWKSVLFKTEKKSFEYNLANDCVFIPIDQRITNSDLDIIINFFKKWMS